MSPFISKIKGIEIDKEFRAMKEELQEKRKISITHGRVLSDYIIVGKPKKKGTYLLLRQYLKFIVKICHFCYINIKVYHFNFGTRHANTCLWAYADSEDLDQPVHPPSLIRPFVVLKQIILT